MVFCLEPLPPYTQSRHYYYGTVHICLVVSKYLSLPLLTIYLLNTDLPFGFIFLKHIL